MIIVISPAKTLDYETPAVTKKQSQPEFLDDAEELIALLARMPKHRVAKLMGLSDKLAQLNVDRYRSWERPFDSTNARQALLAFKGDVYQGFELDRWKAADFTFAQKHIRILSGLYGLLRPLDLMQPYRLEMGTKLKNPRGKDLYAFWGDTLTMAVNQAAKASRAKCLVNLASNEYFGAINTDLLDMPVVTPVFKDEKNGKYKVISFFAKKARGMMANYLVQNRHKTTEGLRGFDVAGYCFDEQSSDDSTLVFLRKEDH